MQKLQILTLLSEIIKILILSNFKCPKYFKIGYDQSTEIVIIEFLEVLFTFELLDLL